MKTKMVWQLGLILSVVAVSFSTRSVHAEATRSVNAIPITPHVGPIGFSWDEFGLAVGAGALGGAAAGAVACLFGTPSIAAGAAAGYVGGAVGAGVAYLASHSGGSADQMLAITPVHALD